MEYLTERLEIRLQPEMMGLLRKKAGEQNVSVAQIVRQAIEVFLHENQSKMEAAQALFQIGARVNDWEDLEREIEEAELQDSPSASRLQQLAQEHSETAGQVLGAVVQDALDRLEKELIHIETEHFWELHDELVTKYSGEHVAMHKGQVVDHDADGSKLERRVRQQFGSLPVLIAPVQAGPRRDLVWRGGRLENRRAVE